MNKNLLIILFLQLWVLNTQAAMADLEIFLNFEDVDQGSVFGQIGEFTVTVTNNGPETAGSTSTTGFPISVISSLVLENEQGSTDLFFAQNFNISQECFFRLIAVDPPPGSTDFGFVFVINTPLIPANSSFVCHGLYQVGFQEGTRDVEWRALVPTGDTDPDLSNNIGNVQFRIRPEEAQKVPSLNLITTFIVMLLMLLITTLKFNNESD